MTGQDIQDRLDAIVDDLQTKGKGKTVNIMFRNEVNSPLVLPLSSDVNGVVDQAQLTAINNFIGDVISNADVFENLSAPVTAAREAFKTAQTPHEALMTAATNARKSLNDALEADAGYQAAKDALNAAQGNPQYVAARAGYDEWNVSENHAALQKAKGEYVG